MTASGRAGASDDFGRGYWRSVATAREPLASLSAEGIDDATFRLLADNLPTLCWVANGDGYIVWYNRRWHEYCGTTPEAMEGWGWRSVHDPARLPDVLARWTASVATGEPFEMTFPLRGADGVLRPFLTRIQPVRDASGTVARWFGVNTEISDQVAAQEALRAERDRGRRVLDGMTEGFALLDREFRILDINAEGLRLDARPREAIVGGVHWEVYPGTEDGDLGRLYKRAMAEGEPVSLEHRYAWEDGHEAWLEMRAYPVADGLAVFYRDVTGRKRAEDELRALNADLERQVVERSQVRGRTWAVTPDLMGALNADGYFETSNPAWQSLLGWSEAEVRSTPIWDLLHPDDVERTREVFRLTQVGQPVIRFPNRYRHKDGSYRWISWVAVPEGGVVYGVGRDVTDEKEREAALAASTAEHDRVWRNSLDILAIASAQGVFHAVSPAWTRILGYEASETVGRGFQDFVAEDDAEPTQGAVDAAAGGADVDGFENRYRHKDGSTRRISWRTSTEGGLIYGFGRDVTAEKARAAELAQAQEQLRQSQKMEAVGQLTGGLAHDFNNLLAGISGSLDMMETRIAQGRVADVERYMLAAQGAARRAAALTHRLLAFSRRQTLEPKPTDANRLVADMEELIRRTVGPAVAVEAVATGGLWTTLVDPHQLENALLNLCLNARDAMPEGGRIIIETANRWLDERAARERDLAPGQYVALCVSDDGVGMAPEVVERAFDPFFTTKPIGEGTGLGLSMIYGFARQSGGQARIYSEPGQGTMACLYLPRHHGEEEGGAPEAEPAPARAEAGQTVLVIEDEALVRMVVVDLLEELGYAAIEAGDGPKGLDVLRSQARVDLLITDVGLPGGMNGRQVADAARALRPDLRVLFVTGYAENAVLSHGHLEPGMAVVTKPFDMARLTSRIREMIAGG